MRPSGVLAGVPLSNQGKCWIDAGPVAYYGHKVGRCQETLGIPSRVVMLGITGATALGLIPAGWKPKKTLTFCFRTVLVDAGRLPRFFT